MPSPSVTPGGHPAGAAAGRRSRADRAYRRAWWSLALYPVSLVAAFVVGEGLLSLLTDDTRDPAFWQVLVAGGPALVVFVIPGILAARQGRVAARLGHPQGRLPARIGSLIGLGFVGLNLASYLVGLAAERWT